MSRHLLSPILGLLLCLLLPSITSTTSSSNSNIVSITPHTFHALITSTHFHVTIAFKTDWCSHCKKLKPVWEDLADYYVDSEHVVIGEVDCEEFKEFCQLQNVPGYPCIRFYGMRTLDDDPTEVESVQYHGVRTLKQIRKWIDDNVRQVDQSHEIHDSGATRVTQDNFDNVVWKDKHVLLYFYSDWSDKCKRFAPAFSEMVNLFEQDDNVIIGRVNGYRNPKLKEKFGITPQYPRIFFLPAQEEGEYEEYNGRLSLTALVKFVNERASTSVTISDDESNFDDAEEVMDQDSDTEEDQESSTNEFFERLKHVHNLDKYVLRQLAQAEEGENPHLLAKIREKRERNAKIFEKVQLPSFV